MLEGMNFYFLIHLKFGLDRDNVELEYKEWENLWHVFQVESLIPESQESFKLVSKFLNKYLRSQNSYSIKL